jgi:uncharacterized protein Usg
MYKLRLVHLYVDEEEKTVDSLLCSLQFAHKALLHNDEWA